ncbi:hypothetical protein ACFL9T_13625 [Thermodesulfobacteriota bacterium]
MNRRIKKLAALICVIAIFALLGCSVKVSKPVTTTKLSEYIYHGPENKDYSQAGVAVFRFESPNLYSMVSRVQTPDPGYAAAHRLYQQLLQGAVFKKLVALYDHEGLTLARKIEIARGEGCELLITGTVPYYFEGGPLSESKVEQEITVIDVMRQETVLYAASTAVGKPVDYFDYIIIIAESQPAPPASSLLVANARKFTNLLSGFTSQ